MRTVDRFEIFCYTVPMHVTLNKVLYAVIIALAALIALGTIIALATKHTPGKDLRKADPTPQELERVLKAQKKSAFTKLGQLRTSTAPDENDKRSVIIITPWLEYASDDQAFYEELDGKIRSIRALITNYFIDYTKDQLFSQGEPTVKAALLARINEQLVLGQISALYFNDYQFLN